MEARNRSNTPAPCSGVGSPCTPVPPTVPEPTPIELYPPDWREPRGATLDSRPGPAILLRRCLGGRSEEDWRLLVEEYERPLRGLLIRLSRVHSLYLTDDELEDLLQDLYLRLLRHQGEPFVGWERGRFWAYLATTARHILIDRWRHEHSAKRGFSLETAGLMSEYELEFRFCPKEARRVAHHLSDRRPSPEQALVRRRGLDSFLRYCAASHHRSVERRSVASRSDASRSDASRSDALLPTSPAVDAPGGPSAETEITGLYLVYIEGRTSPEVSQALGQRLSPRQVDTLVVRFRRFMARQGIALPGRRPAGRKRLRHRKRRRVAMG